MGIYFVLNCPRIIFRKKTKCRHDLSAGIKIDLEALSKLGENV